MNLSQAIYNQPDGVGIFNLGDLREFALELIAETERRTVERLSLATEKTESDVRLTRLDVEKTYHVSPSTLTRWAKAGYLKPDGYIGRKPYYHAKTIERVIKTKNT